MTFRIHSSVSLLAAALFVATSPRLAIAACAIPTGEAGEMVYNGDYATMQYCDGTNWVSMASNIPAKSPSAIFLNRWNHL